MDAPLQLGTLADGTTCRSSHDAITIDFAAASVTHSNLGHQGPHVHAPPTLLLANVGRIGGHRIDLEVSNTTAYEAHAPSVSNFDAGANGLKPSSNGTFGRVALRAPATGTGDLSYVGLRFTFLDAGADGRDAIVSLFAKHRPPPQVERLPGERSEASQPQARCLGTPPVELRGHRQRTRRHRVHHALHEIVGQRRPQPCAVREPAAATSSRMEPTSPRAREVGHRRHATRFLPWQVLLV